MLHAQIATGGSAIRAIGTLVERGVPEENIIFLNIISCAEGLENVWRAHPKVRVVTTAVDDGLDEHKFIVPGLGDFGDRYFGTQ